MWYTELFAVSRRVGGEGCGVRCGDTVGSRPLRTRSRRLQSRESADQDHLQPARPHVGHRQHLREDARTAILEGIEHHLGLRVRHGSRPDNRSLDGVASHALVRHGRSSRWEPCRDRGYCSYWKVAI